MNKEFYIDSETGELIEKEDKNELATKEANEIITDTFIDQLVQQEYLSQQIEMFKTANKDKFKEIMKKYGVKSIKTEYATITYVGENMQERFDSKRFQEEQPELFEKYKKFVAVKDSLRVKLKGNND